LLALRSTPQQNLVHDGNRKKNRNHTNATNTDGHRDLRGKPKREKPRVELEARRRLHYDGISKRDTRHTAHPTTPTSAIHSSHTPSFYNFSTQELSSTQETLSFTHTLYTFKKTSENLSTLF
jgi:hypothetical protein